jgi:hypothetical protein
MKGEKKMKKLLFPVIALTLLLLMAAAVSASADTIWTIGDIEQFFADPADTMDEFSTSFPGTDTTTYNVNPSLVVQDPSSFPGRLYHLGTSWDKDTGVHEVTIDFSLDLAYSELTLDYYRLGEEDDEVALDGGTSILLDGPGEGVWTQHTETWDDVCSGNHSIVITCVDLSGGGFHYVDALVLSGNPIMPAVDTEIISGPTEVVINAEETWWIEITVTGDDEVGLYGVVVQDGMGADLDDIVIVSVSPGTVVIEKKTVGQGKQKMRATMVTWTLDLTAGAVGTLVIEVTTGWNAKAIKTENYLDKWHEFTEEEYGHELDGGASATFWYCDTEFSTDETDPLLVDVIPAP